MNPNIVIFLAQIVPCQYQNNAIIALNRMLPGLVKRKKTRTSPVILVNHYKGIQVKEHMYDGIHLNEKGEKEMAKRWFLALKSYWQGIAKRK